MHLTFVPTDKFERDDRESALKYELRMIEDASCVPRVGDRVTLDDGEPVVVASVEWSLYSSENNDGDESMLCLVRVEPASEAEGPDS